MSDRSTGRVTVLETDQGLFEAVEVKQDKEDASE